MTMLESTLLQLKVIAKLADYDSKDIKLNVRTGEPIIKRSTIFSSIIRFIQGESRVATMTYIVKTFQNCNHIIELYFNSTFLQLSESMEITEYQYKKATDILLALKSLSDALEDSIKGLDTLRTLYLQDCTVCAKLEILKKKAQRMIINIAHTIERTDHCLNKGSFNQKKRIIQ